MPFNFEPQSIPGVVLIQPKVIGDARGFFMETYKASAWESAGVTSGFMQGNHSRSRRGILRGLHFQLPPYGQAKLVRAVVGEIFDVAVDLRSDSPTFGKWVGVRLSDQNRAMLYIPEWCAHGFLVLSEIAEVVYKTSAEYAPEYERGVMWNDARVSIDWPITEPPSLSDRDLNWPAFDVSVGQLSETAKTKWQVA